MPQQDTLQDTLHLYDIKLKNQALERQVNKYGKSALVVILAHLEMPGMQDYNKETCVTSLIFRLQNLMPDQCGLCKQRYCVKLADIPLLSCKICGQGSHDSCIMDHLKISYSDRDSLTPSKAWERVILCFLGYTTCGQHAGRTTHHQKRQANWRGSWTPLHMKVE